MSIGLRIKELRQNNNLSQEAFAASIGIKRANLGQIEAGNQLPTIKIITEIVRIYNIDYAYLIEGANKTIGAISDEKMYTQNVHPDVHLNEKSSKTNGAISEEREVIYQSQQQIIEDQKVLIQNYKDIIDYMRSQEGIKEAEIKRLQAEVDRLASDIKIMQEKGCDQSEECSQKRKVS